jgi:DNA modification methylase
MEQVEVAVMEKPKKLVSEQRNYAVLSTKDAHKVVDIWLKSAELENALRCGLPEIDDRYHYWRVPLVNTESEKRVGEIVIDAYTSLVIEDKSSSKEVLEQRLLKRDDIPKAREVNSKQKYTVSGLRNTIALGDSEKILRELPAGSVNLVFTSPPYYNARPEYEDYITYEEYLLKIRKIIKQSHRVLSEGAFFVMNVAPVLIRRANRNEASRRIAVPFDMHRLFVEEGFDFIDDIIWVKPEGAGWATGRGRRFAADRNPLQYKSVPVTEYILVYRKHTARLIDWHIRSHPDSEIVQASKIQDPYERTNVWKITPAHDKKHPAIFPDELAEKVIKYYSFIDDVVLDPFAGIGTVGGAAVRLGRRFVLIEKSPKYIEEIRARAVKWLGKEAENIFCINCPSIQANTLF